LASLVGMENTEACAILRVPIEASRSEVETAFRKRMREVRARFDAARGMSLRAQYQREFAAIRDAQDCLLSELVSNLSDQPTSGEPQVPAPRVDEPTVQEAEVNAPPVNETPVSEPLMHEPRTHEIRGHEDRADEPKVGEAEVDAARADEPQVADVEIDRHQVDGGQLGQQIGGEPQVDASQVDGERPDELLVHEATTKNPLIDKLPTEAPAELEQPVPLLSEATTVKSPQPTVSVPDQLSAGQLFVSRFELQRELEIGSTGEIWLAQDHVSRRQVALIFLPDLIMSDKVGIGDLRSELHRRAKLNHSNILHIFDLVEGNGRIAIEIEPPVGRSLSELRFGRPNHVFEVGELQTWVTQLCEALQYAHVEAGLVHGNIQPGNLMVDNNGSLKVKDFAISNCLSESISRSTGIPKTSEALQYKSPQQAAGKAATVTDDLYSLGATLYESLTSRPPFSAREIALRQNLKKPPTMTERRAELGIQGASIPLSWEETVAACLATDPSRRPQSAADVARRLQNAVPLPVIPAAAPTPPPPPPAAAPPRPPPLPPSLKPGPAATAKVPSSISTPPLRKPWVAIAGILLVLAIGSAIALVFHFLAEPKQGKFFVKTKPDEATVFIDGADRGTTPLVLENLAPGDHRLTIALNGYRREELIVPIKRGAPDFSLNIDLVQARASLSSTVTPSQSESTTQESSSSRPTPSPEVSTTPSVGGNAGVDETPSAGASEPPSSRVSETPSSELSKTESAQEGASPSGSLSATATPLSRQEIEVTKEEVIKRINALPGLSTAAKDRLIEKMDRARSMERLTVIPFDFGQTVSRRGATDKLVQTFDSPAMREALSDPTIVLVVAGYADAGGRADLNLRISQQRAEYVTKILKERANLLNAMQTIGMGGSELLDSSRPDQNRAVEVWAVVPY
jgi:serine/threonine protein kinase